MICEGDPFYEFGSFGCTTCHCKNLLHPNRAEELQGSRLAFVQGGRLGSRLVFLTPPITEVRKWRKLDRGKWIRFTEVKWKPAEMPFRYEESPSLVRNNHSSQFSLVKKFAMKARGRTIEGRLCSKIRSRTEPLGPELAREIVDLYERSRVEAAGASPSPIASTYDEALPSSPSHVPKRDRNRKARKASYDSFHERLHGDTDCADEVSYAEGVTRETHSKARCGQSRRRKSSC